MQDHPEKVEVESFSQEMACSSILLLFLPSLSSLGAADRSVPAISDSSTLSGDGREELSSVNESSCRLWAVSWV